MFFLLQKVCGKRGKYLKSGSHSFQGQKGIKIHRESVWASFGSNATFGKGVLLFLILRDTSGALISKGRLCLKIKRTKFVGSDSSSLWYDVLLYIQQYTFWSHCKLKNMLWMWRKKQGKQFFLALITLILFFSASQNIF